MMNIAGARATTNSGTDRAAGGEGWKAGAALGGIAAIASMQRSLLPRSTTQQAMVTAGSIALGYGVGVGASAIADRVDAATGLDAVGARLAVGTAGAVGAIGLSLALRGRPNLALETARTTAGVVGAGAVAGAALIGEQALVDRIEGSVPGGAAGAHVRSSARRRSAPAHCCSDALGAAASAPRQKLRTSPRSAERRVLPSRSHTMPRTSSTSLGCAAR